MRDPLSEIWNNGLQLHSRLKLGGQAFFLLIAIIATVTEPHRAFARPTFNCPVRESWNPDSGECPCKEGWKPAARVLDDIRVAHERWYELEGWKDKRVSGQAILCNANLAGLNFKGTNLFGADLREASLLAAELQDVYLRGADLRGASLILAQLTNADLTLAKFQGASFFQANLESASFVGAELREADFTLANLKNANLGRVSLQDAKLLGANLENTRLEFSDLNGVIYAPASPPPNTYLEGIKGLKTVVFPSGRQSGLVQLRKLLQNTGLREKEREVTFAIERGKAFHARRSASLVEQLSGWLSMVLFEWTTAWGLHPSRALLILVGLLLGFSVIYAAPIALPQMFASGQNGIFRVWPRERLEPADAGIRIVEVARVERLTAGPLTAFPWALYFSAISAFHVGWRDLNVGTWLMRIQPSETTLRALGWIRVIAGFQFTNKRVSPCHLGSNVLWKAISVTARYRKSVRSWQILLIKSDVPELAATRQKLFPHMAIS